MKISSEIQHPVYSELKISKPIKLEPDEKNCNNFLKKIELKKIKNLLHSFKAKSNDIKVGKRPKVLENLILIEDIQEVQSVEDNKNKSVIEISDSPVRQGV